MTPDPTAASRAGSALLGPAALVLRGQGYMTQPVALSAGNTLLLAENDFFAMGIVEFNSTAELPAVEARAAGELAERLAAAPNGAKSWDTYLVLLSSLVRSEDAMPEAVTAVVYNTRFLRRIVRWNVQPEEISLARALRPFLPLTTAQTGKSVGAVKLLVERLPSYGVSPESAAEAMAQWRTSGTRS